MKELHQLPGVGRDGDAGGGSIWSMKQQSIYSVFFIMFTVDLVLRDWKKDIPHPDACVIL